MQTIVLEAERRMPGKKSDLKQLRANGNVPATLYHKGEPSISLSVKEQSLRKVIYTTESHIINLRFTDGTEKPSVMKDYQFNPLTDSITHADFQLLKSDEYVEVEVPILFTGNPVGVVKGGMVQATLHKLEIRCLPSDMPEHITVDISSMDMGESLHVGELSSKIQEKIEFTVLTDSHAPVISVLAPRVVADAAPVAPEA
ncbi:ribosomal 5S rRNA E-loop binding protein Ctc/L25/TL5 [Chloroherpeton thalassium ATCC 35110]|uniref:Large ribosomal subunit protein bL25 n=1 Tax=Chloroherpeton thalassium (strain ATCC 35110 / GB-78) TaxID=517418 RepID=RL25_CHLT3|nr:50S ribosomal protein L25/general stress protein Ctc [Chloroherpeton thalassium]B3QWH6.1 RecName: Full=Large ribosomal subunit protein bL25; AltName: Full=50S ribosomal protein L25; AltName: Full=General stress protein CTC [Chloroherpeton thalassium ATCC 35110]ACF14736.1 ribosomal 5S rRNA E-loop binding protein Ctc/L25/TL5 [Chloroherpeton thalassium ATCC 35110]